MTIPFENDQNIKRDYTFSEILLLIKTLNTPDDKTYESKLAREIGCSPSRISVILKYLETLNIVINHEQIGANKMITINKSLLKHFIDEQDILIWLEKYFLNKYNTYIYENY